MKRINPVTNKPFRCGDTNPLNGMVFRCYDLNRVRKDGTFVELWLSPDSFSSVRSRMKDRARKRRKLDAHCPTGI